MIGLPFLPPDARPECMSAPDAFVDDRGGPPERGVLQVCASCEWRLGCAEYGIQHAYLDGVWGGLTATSRRATHKKLGLPDLQPRYEISAMVAASRRGVA